MNRPVTLARLPEQLQQAAALHQLGVIAARSGDFAGAVNLIGRSIDADPSNPAAFNDRGIALKGLGQYEAALASIDRAIALLPGYAAAHNNRANVLRELRRWDAALASYDRAIMIDPAYSEAHGNRAVLLNDLHQWEAAVAGFDRAIAAQPANANAHCNRGVALEHLGELGRALEDYERAVALDPRFVQAYSNRGNVLRQLGRIEAALASCDRAIALSPEHAAAHQNRALALLLRGDWTEGWAEYEWRWKNPHSALAKDHGRFTQPLWSGQEGLAGKTILLHAEQGLGDTLQFCRYAPRIAERGAQVVMEVQGALLEVLAGLDGVAQFVARGQPLPPFDCHCPLLSLPRAFGTTPHETPAQTPYLRSDVHKTRAWAERLASTSKRRVGLVWSGGFRPNQPEVWAVDRRRNIELAMLAPLRHSGIEFFSLQKGESAEAELAQLLAGGWDGPRLTDFTGLLSDFSDTAALIQQLDLVISVDTSTAHLAGALGKPVWLLNRFDTCWRWLLERSDTPWYPSARLFRQEEPGAWSGVVRRVAADLAAFAG